MITVTRLSMRIKNQLVLDGATCLLIPGRITTFLGESGAGKTTLLKSIAGIISATDGQILINNTCIANMRPTQRAKTIGYVFQEFNLFPHLTALGNCIDSLLIHGIRREEAVKKAKRILNRLGIGDYVDKYPVQLSGGQQQRVAIARALCLEPTALLLDEPSAALDPANTGSLIAILQNLAAQGITIGVASHDMLFVRKIFDRVYYIDTGKIVELCDGKDNLQKCPAISNFCECFSNPIIPFRSSIE